MFGKNFRLNKKISINLAVFGIFLLLSYISIALFMHEGKIILRSDGSFHLSRVEEIYQNLRDGHFFTFIASRTFSHSGVGNFLFYPTVFLYPMAFLRFIFNPVTAFYLWVGFFNFLTMATAYYCMYRFTKGNTTRSFLFALIYTFASYHLYLGLYNTVWGEFIAYTFLPLIFLGIYNILWDDTKYWYILAIGMALLLYSHLLSVYMSAMICVGLFLAKFIFYKKVEFLRIKALIKAGILTFFLSSFIFVPIATDLIGGGLATPRRCFLWVSTIFTTFQLSLENTAATNHAIGLILILTAFLGWIIANKSSRELAIYALGVFMLCLTTSLIPWDLIQKTPLYPLLGTIQFPYRFNSYACLFLAVTASLIFESIVRLGKSQYTANILTVIASLALLCCYASIVAPQHASIIAAKDSSLSKNTASPVTIPSDVLLDKGNYKNIFTYLIMYGETDYYPKQSFDHNDISSNKNTQSIVKQTVYSKNKPFTGVTTISYAANSITYKLVSKKKQTLDLPTIRYRRTVATINGKSAVVSSSARGTVSLPVPKGHSTITVSYRPNLLYYTGLIAALISWLSIPAYLFYQKKKSA